MYKFIHKRRNTLQLIVKTGNTIPICKRDAINALVRAMDRAKFIEITENTFQLEYYPHPWREEREKHAVKTHTLTQPKDNQRLKIVNTFLED